MIQLPISDHSESPIIKPLVTPNCKSSLEQTWRIAKTSKQLKTKFNQIRGYIYQSWHTRISFKLTIGKPTLCYSGSGINPSAKGMVRAPGFIASRICTILQAQCRACEWILQFMWLWPPYLPEPYSRPTFGVIRTAPCRVLPNESRKDRLIDKL
jgi:hypothetical protein